MTCCAKRCRARSSAAATTSIPSSRCSTSAPRAGARWWWQLETTRTLSATDRSLIEVFCSRLSVAFDNVILYEQLHEANVRLEERVRERTRALTSANERLTSQWARIRRANEYKNEVLGTVAHDLRNPLSVILGRAEMMNELAAMNPVPLDKVKDQLGHIRSSASQLTGMVNDLISDAMMNALDIAIKREPADLAAMLGEIVASNRALAEKKDQTIHLVSPPHQIVELRSGPAARGHRQSGQQCHQIQSDRGHHRAVDGRRRRWRGHSGEGRRRRSFA